MFRPDGLRSDQSKYKCESIDHNIQSDRSESEWKWNNG